MQTWFLCFVFCNQHIPGRGLSWLDSWDTSVIYPKNKMSWLPNWLTNHAHSGPSCLSIKVTSSEVPMPSGVFKHSYCLVFLFLWSSFCVRGWAWYSPDRLYECFELQENTWEDNIWQCGMMLWVDNRTLNTWFGASFLPYIISIRWVFSPCSTASRATWLYHTPDRRGNNLAVLTRERAEGMNFGCDHPFHTKLVNIKPFGVREKQKHAVT